MGGERSWGEQDGGHGAVMLWGGEICQVVLALPQPFV